MIEDWISVKLVEAEQTGRTRRADAQPQNGVSSKKMEKRILNFSGNDYLNLSKHPHVIERARSATSKPMEAEQPHHA